MSQNFEKLIETAGGEYSLSADERAKMSRVINEYVAHKPLRTPRSYSVSISYSWLSFAHRPLAAALVLVLVGGTGISYAAENALPGDSLYAVKTYINEPVRIALATTAEAKANVQIDLAERRIDEAAALASEGRLDSKTQQDLAVAFESHATAASDNIQKTDDTDSPAAAEIASRFETRLAAHDAVLAEVQSDDNADTADLSNAIHDAGRAIAAIRTRAEENASVSDNVIATVAAAPAAATLSFAAKAISPQETATTDTTEDTAATSAEKEVSRSAALRMHDAANSKFNSVRAAVEANTDLDANAKARAEDQFTQVQGLLADGDTQLENDEIAVAFHSFQDALVITEKMDVLLKAAPTLAKAHSRFSQNGRNNDRGRGKNATDIKASTSFRATTTVQISAPASIKVEIHNGTSATGDIKVQNILPPTVQIFPSDEGNDSHDGDGGSNKIKVNISL